MIMSKNEGATYTISDIKNKNEREREKLLCIQKVANAIILYKTFRYISKLFGSLKKKKKNERRDCVGLVE